MSIKSILLQKIKCVVTKKKNKTLKNDNDKNLKYLEKMLFFNDLKFLI